MELKDNLSKSGNLEETIKDFFGNSNKKDTKSNPSGCLGCLGLIILIVTISIIADSFKSCSQSVSSRKDEKILAELLAGKTYSGESEWTRVMGHMVKASIRVDFVKEGGGVPSLRRPHLAPLHPGRCTLGHHIAIPSFPGLPQCTSVYP